MFRFRQHISIALTTAFVFGMLWQSYTIVHFYLNQERITEEHCVNQDKPELNCKGQCHLKKQLEAAKPGQEEKKESPGSAKTSILLLVYTQPGEDLIFDRFDESKASFGLAADHTIGYTSDIFEPPQRG